MKKRGRPRKHRPAEPVDQAIEQPIVQRPDPNEEIPVRLGLRPVVTSKGASDGTHRIVVPGAVVSLPRHEGENLVNMGYASHV